MSLVSLLFPALMILINRIISGLRSKQTRGWNVWQPLHGWRVPNSQRRRQFQSSDFLRQAVPRSRQTELLWILPQQVNYQPLNFHLKDPPTIRKNLGGGGGINGVPKLKTSFKIPIRQELQRVLPQQHVPRLGHDPELFGDARRYLQRTRRRSRRERIRRPPRVLCRWRQQLNSRLKAA